MNDVRKLRIESFLQEEISKMIVQQKIKDPRISSMLSVSRVQVAGDLSLAKVFVSSFEGRKKQEKAVSALNHAAGWIQKSLGKSMRTKRTPKLQFINDHNIEDAVNINQRIDHLDEDLGF